MKTSITFLIALAFVATPLVGALSAGPGLLAPTSPLSTATVTDVTITSFDGTKIAATVFQPAGADDAHTVPIVLHSHGWGGTRVTELSGTVGALVAAGYGVLTFDARGHGESGSVATVHNEAYEVKDFSVILDWIHANLDWVTKSTEDGPDDLLAGAFGYSYGGGFQTQTASHDGRLDALVPEMTWHDLRYSLAPQGVAKSVWVDALYWSAKAGGTRIHGDIDDWYQSIMLTNEVPQVALDHFERSSPTFAHADDVNVLVIQGIPDVLFNLNEGIANYLAFSAGSTGDVRLSTHLTGHVLPGVQPLGLDPYRTNQDASRYPCGDMEVQTLAWFDEHLRGNAGAADFIPEVAFALENGECVERNGLPTDSVTVTLDALAASSSAGSLHVPLVTGAQTIAGIPHLSARVTGVGDAVLTLGLVVVGPDGGAHVVDDQATPARIDAGADTLDVDLAGVATRLGPADTLFLRVDGLNEWYAHNGDRTAGVALLEDVTVTLPLV